MIFLLLICVIVSIAVFLDIQKYLSNPDLEQMRDEWFAQFAEFNRSRQSHPDVVWRYSAIEQSFHKQGFGERI